jgi:hypothetical protein
MHKETILGMSHKGFFLIKNTKGIYFLGIFLFLRILQMPTYLMSYIYNLLSQF